MANTDEVLSGSYCYEPLDTEKQQFRLLKIAQNDSGPINCEIEIFDLDDAPTYDSLSYTWGPPVTNFEVLLNGRPFRIRQNLFRFLETYRRERQDAYLWCDQICIAQSNVEERNHQVHLMSRIYSQCSSTIVWLCDEQAIYPSLARDFIRTGRKSSLEPLLRDAYFSRIWIVQEVLLSSNPIILTNGNVWVPWSKIRGCFKEKAWGAKSYGVVKFLALPEIYRSKEHWTLSQLIDLFSANDCEDKRDKVYSLLGLVGEGPVPVVDYDKSVFEVYADVITMLPHKTRDRHFKSLGLHMGLDADLWKGLKGFLGLIQPLTLCHHEPHPSRGFFSDGIGFFQEPVDVMEELWDSLASFYDPSSASAFGRSTTKGALPGHKSDRNLPHACSSFRFRYCKVHDHPSDTYSIRLLNQACLTDPVYLIKDVEEYCSAMTDDDLAPEAKSAVKRRWAALVSEMQQLQGKSYLQAELEAWETKMQKDLLEWKVQERLGFFTWGYSTIWETRRDERVRLRRTQPGMSLDGVSYINTLFYTVDGETYRFLETPDWKAVFQLDPFMMRKVIDQCRQTRHI